jgi:hypothetical protein
VAVTNRKKPGSNPKIDDSFNHVSLSDKLQWLGSFILKNAVGSVTMGARRWEKMGSRFLSSARMLLGKTEWNVGS